MATNAERIALVAHARDGDDPPRANAGEGRRRHWMLAIGMLVAVLAIAAVGGRSGGTSHDEGALGRLGIGLDANEVGDWMGTHREWRIVSFVNKEYETIARLWYHRLSNLGYDSHHLVALDDLVYDSLKRANFRVLRAPGFTMNNGDSLSDFWKFRLNYLLDEVKRGQNVLMSDLDIVFAHHYEPEVIFNKAEDEDVDIFHSLGAGWPKTAKDRWGFSICMGFSAFKATKTTEKTLEAALGVCSHATSCDDQVVMNELYMNYLQMSWTSNFENGERKGISRNTMIPLVVKTLASLVPRVRPGSLEDVPKGRSTQCLGHVHHVDGGHWAVAPVIEKDGTAKVEMWRSFHDKCYEVTVSALGAQWAH